jgi:hypothetical protein
MSDCMWLSDRMPAVALGRAEWTLDEARHLSECRSCQEEWDLVRVTSRVGEGIVLAHDTARTTEAVLRRLEHSGEHLRPRLWALAGLAAAAAILAAVWTGGRDPRPAPQAGPVVAGLQIRLPELESLQPAELDSVLQTMDEPVVDGSTVDDPGLGDLDSDELQRVLDSWEG